MNVKEAVNVVVGVITANRLNITLQEGSVIAEAIRVLGEHFKDEEEKQADG